MNLLDKSGTIADEILTDSHRKVWRTVKIIEKIFGTHSQRELKRIAPLVAKIEELRPQMQALSDEELRGKTAEFRKRLAEGATLDDLLVEA